MRRRRHPLPLERDPRLEMGSMIDVSFLLLIFFIVATTLMEREHDLPLALAGPPETVQLAEPDPVVIGVEADGRVLLGDARDSLMELEPAGGPHNMPALREHLRTFVIPAAHAKSGVPQIRLWVADEAEHQRFADLLASLRREQLSQIVISEEPLR